jgi:hypothetical protein
MISDKMNIKSPPVDYIELLDFEDNEGEPPIIDEKNFDVLKKDEICPVTDNEGGIFFFNKEQFVKVFSEIFRATPHVFKPYSGGAKDIEMVIFKNEDYTYVFDVLKKRPLYFKYQPDGSESEREVAISVHPTTRYCSVTNNRNLTEERIDVLPFIQRDKHTVTLDKLLCRVYETIQNELNRIDNRKVDYIR